MLESHMNPKTHNDLKSIFISIHIYFKIECQNNGYQISISKAQIELENE